MCGFSFLLFHFIASSTKNNFVLRLDVGDGQVCRRANVSIAEPILAFGRRSSLDPNQHDGGSRRVEIVRPHCVSSPNLSASSVCVSSLGGIAPALGRLNRTGRKALLKLVGLVGVLEDEGVEVLLAADLELNGLSLLVLLDASSCERNSC